MTSQASYRMSGVGRVFLPASLSVTSDHNSRPAKEGSSIAIEAGADQAVTHKGSYIRHVNVATVNMSLRRQSERVTESILYRWPTCLTGNCILALKMLVVASPRSPRYEKHNEKKQGP
jgi:hypothetical protein